MCGIFAVATTKDDAPQKVLAGLKVLEYRGYDSWGVASLDKGKKIVVEKEAGKIGDGRVTVRSVLSIGHTRWATHGGVTRENAHPHLSCNHDYAVVHNGIIDNYQQLKNKQIKAGHTFLSATDSEVVAHAIESQSLFEVFESLRGLNSIVCLDGRNGIVWGVKQGSPLVVGFGKGENYLASDAAALLPLTKQVYFLEDGQGVKLSADEVSIIDIRTRNVVDIKSTVLDWKVQDAQLIGFDHFLIKEINEQPAIIRTIADQARSDVEKLARLIRRSYGTFFVACGTAYHAALAGVYMFSKLDKRHVNHVSGGEFTYTADFVTRGSLVIPISQSGETIDVIESVSVARKHGATIAALVNVVGSTLYRMGDAAIPLRAGPEKSVLATKSYLAQLSLLLMTALCLSGRVGELEKLLFAAADEIERIIKSLDQEIHDLAHRLKDVNDIYLLGRGSSYPDALEGALKIKEVTYIHAEGFAGGDLKHGSIALIEKDTPVIVFAPLDDTHDAIISNAMEVKARGAFVIGISPIENSVFDVHIKVADVGAASNLVNIIPIQLLAYYLALERGCDPDKPRNLAKSVTVR